ncbi:hypothetical protein [uncultured Tateyamaria sp.]|uniref:hypothetical protein n=1 Tax=uncultured Tateyamaria sp. TaxID=455651 RepID=UPI0026045082|nr:hypothetical protein [uncultured Tateyamaria sp.]
MGSNRLEFLEFSDLRLIGLNHRGIGGAQNSVQNSLDLLVDVFDLALTAAQRVLCLGDTLVPRVAEHGFGERDELCRGLEHFDYLTHLKREGKACRCHKQQKLVSMENVEGARHKQCDQPRHRKAR